MFYETAHTVGPGWQRSFKPSHYEEMSWSPSGSHFRSPGASPETYRRRTPPDDDFRGADDDFFSPGGTTTFPRRVFKEGWPEGGRLGDHRPRMFKRVFRPDQWEEEFDRSDSPHLRRVDRKFDDAFDRRFQRDLLKKDLEDEFERSEGRVHHIPIMVEKRMEDLKSRFGRSNKASPPEKTPEGEEYSEDWEGPQVQRLRKTFEKEDGFPSRHFQQRHSGPRPFNATSQDTWDPHAVHTLPTRRGHKSFDDSRHPVPPKHVYRSYSETHEAVPKPQPQHHSAAFRSHSDGHCPDQTYVTKIEVTMPTPTRNDEPGSPDNRPKNATAPIDREDERPAAAVAPDARSKCRSGVPQDTPDEATTQGEESPAPPDGEVRPKWRGGKHESQAMQQIAVVLQNVEDLVQRVEGYSGTGRDKQYRFLDEMLTRCMLRLDDVDTEGREDIRTARKEAVREVQACVDRLEEKADESERRQKQSVIPLGDVPRKEDAKGQDQKESGPEQDSKQEKDGNAEQTKL